LGDQRALKFSLDSSFVPALFLAEPEIDENWAHSGFTVITEVTSLFYHYEIGKSPIKVEA